MVGPFAGRVPEVIVRPREVAAVSIGDQDVSRTLPCGAFAGAGALAVGLAAVPPISGGAMFGTLFPLPGTFGTVFPP